MVYYVCVMCTCKSKLNRHKYSIEMADTPIRNNFMQKQASRLALETQIYMKTTEKIEKTFIYKEK